MVQNYVRHPERVCNTYTAEQIHIWSPTYITGQTVRICYAVRIVSRTAEIPPTREFTKVKSPSSSLPAKSRVLRITAQSKPSGRLSAHPRDPSIFPSRLQGCPVPSGGPVIGNVV